MNILIINSNPFISSLGGVERVSRILADSFVKYYHHNVYFLSFLPKESSFVQEDLPQQQFFLPRTGGFDNDENIDFYRTFLIDKQIDVLINQAGLWTWMDKALAITDVKVISVLHSIPTANVIMEMNSEIHHNNTVLGVGFYFLKILFYPLFLIYREIILLKENRKHYQYLSQKSDAIVALAKDYIRDLKSYGVDKTCLLRNIPNPNTFDVLSEKVEKGKVLLYVGRLSDYDKKPLRLLKIWKRLYRDFPDWKLLIVGDGAAKDDMFSYMEKYKLERVEFKGEVRDVASYYKIADFIILTSNFEGWGMALTEGMTFGCIPLAFNSYGAASEIIDDGINGCLISPFSLKEYVKRLRQLMSDQKIRENYRAAAQKKAEKFSVEKILKEWNSLLQSI